MNTEDDLECGHCGRPLDDCGCGVDREIRYRERYRELTPSDCSIFWVLAIVVSTLLALRALFNGWQ